jgi:hypothetical protein
MRTGEGNATPEEGVQRYLSFPVSGKEKKEIQRERREAGQSKTADDGRLLCGN